MQWENMDWSWLFECTELAISVEEKKVEKLCKWLGFHFEYAVVVLQNILFEPFSFRNLLWFELHPWTTRNDHKIHGLCSRSTRHSMYRCVHQGLAIHPKINHCTSTPWNYTQQLFLGWSKQVSVALIHFTQSSASCSGTKCLFNISHGPSFFVFSFYYWIQENFCVEKPSLILTGFCAFWAAHFSQRQRRQTLSCRTSEW